MKLTIEMTQILTEVDGRPVRLWKGVTPGGRPVDVYVASVATNDVAAMDELDRALQSIAAPVEAIVPAWILTPADPKESR